MRARARLSLDLSRCEREARALAGGNSALSARRARQKHRGHRTPRELESRENVEIEKEIGKTRRDSGRDNRARTQRQRRARGVRALWPVGLEGVLYMSNAKAQVRKLFKKLVSVLPTAHSHAHATHTLHPHTHCIPLRTGLLHRPRAFVTPSNANVLPITRKAACAVRNPSPPRPGARAALPSSWRRCRPPRAGRSGSTRPGGTPSRASPGCRRPTRRGCCR